MTSAELNEMRDAAKRCLNEAFEQLELLHVLPRSRYGPDIHVGSDYRGHDLGGPGFTRLNDAILTAYGQRFKGEGAKHNLEFTKLYLYSFVESAVRRCTLNGERCRAGAQGAAEAIDELVSTLDSPTIKVAACRVVQHLTTHDECPIRIGEVTVQPAEGWDALDEIGQLVPGTSLALPRDPPLSFMSPTSVVYATTETETKPSAATDALSQQVALFLRTVRLYSTSTTSTEMEIRGQTTRIGRMSPHLVSFLTRGDMNVVLQRPTVLDDNHTESLVALSGLLADASTFSEGERMASWDFALARFDKSHQNPIWYENLVDLATALEATLIGDGEENTALTLRLRQRSAALLGCQEDPASAIYDDVGILYDLRSALVHGGDLKLSSLRKRLKKLSTAPEGALDGLLAEVGVDRLKDIARRAILARLCLSTGSDALWPHNKGIPVDRHLSDDHERARWRTTWRQRLDELGLSAAAQPAARLTFLGQEEVP